MIDNRQKFSNEKVKEKQLKDRKLVNYKSKLSRSHLILTDLLQF